MQCGLSSGGNVLLLDVKGVGKTTLMKGCVAVLRELSPTLEQGPCRRLLCRLYEETAPRDHPTCLAISDLLTVGKTENSLGAIAGFDEFAPFARVSSIPQQRRRWSRCVRAISRIKAYRSFP
jgi:hypothetical protein